MAGTTITLGNRQIAVTGVAGNQCPGGAIMTGSAVVVNRINGKGIINRHQTGRTTGSGGMTAGGCTRGQSRGPVGMIDRGLTGMDSAPGRGGSDNMTGGTRTAMGTGSLTRGLGRGNLQDTSGLVTGGTVGMDISGRNGCHEGRGRGRPGITDLGCRMTGTTISGISYPGSDMINGRMAAEEFTMTIKAGAAAIGGNPGWVGHGNNLGGVNIRQSF